MFKVNRKDYTSKEKTIRLLCDIISTKFLFNAWLLFLVEF